MKKLLATVSVIALISAPVFAQDTNVQVTPPLAQDAAPMDPPAAPSNDTTELKMDQSASLSEGQWRSSKLIGQTVRNSANESIGDINDFIVDNTGKVTAVVVGAGGFLGMGEKNVALTFDQLSISRDANNSIVVMANSTKESLENMPAWTDPTVRANQINK